MLRRLSSAARTLFAVMRCMVTRLCQAGQTGPVRRSSTAARAAIPACSLARRRGGSRAAASRAAGSRAASRPGRRGSGGGQQPARPGCSARGPGSRPGTAGNTPVLPGPDARWAGGRECGHDVAAPAFQTIW